MVFAGKTEAQGGEIHVDEGADTRPCKADVVERLSEGVDRLLGLLQVL